MNSGNLYRLSAAQIGGRGLRLSLLNASLPLAEVFNYREAESTMLDVGLT